ncbi:MAG TPA: mechanosensitive ion channel family protein [Cyclobacteriaceae bacterium]|jgi:small-conductance mechanosensitive channel
MEDFLDRTYFNNTVRDYLIALGILLVALLVIRIVRGVLISRLRKWAATTDNTLDDLVVNTVSRFGLPVLNFLALYLAINSLNLSAGIYRVLEVATASVIAFFLIRLVATTIRYLLESYVRRQENGAEKVNQVQGIILIISVVVWGIGLIFLFSNLGYDVTAIIAGLGVGGIAVALAAQNILGDLFNYFVIFFDKPFEVGDFIIVDEKMGTVEHIGIKTTRVKSLTGEQLVFSNSDLTNSRIHNYKRMSRRRIVFALGVIYQTKPEQVREIPDIIREIIGKCNSASLDRVHLKSFDESSITYETVYYVESPEYNVYMDIQQSINLTIFEEFNKRGIEFAYPTRTLFLNREPAEEPEENSKQGPAGKA